MRVDPHFAANLTGGLEQIQSTEQTLTSELSSGVRVSSPGIDPLAAGDNVELTAQISQDDSFNQTAVTEESRLQVADSALGAVVTQLTQAITLATQAGSGTENASNLQSIGSQLGSIRDAVLGLANSSYQGSYLFGGSATSTQPYTLDNSTTPPTAVYSGDTATQTLVTPQGQSITVSAPGSSIFSAAGADVLGTLNALAAQLSTGSAGTGLAAQVAQLTAGLNNVSAQRIPLDTALTTLQSAATYSQTQATALTAAQTTLIGADTAQVATQLSQAETQSQALMAVISTIEKGSLFDYTH